MGIAQRGLDYDFEVSSHDKLPKGKTLQVEIEFAARSSNKSIRYGLKEVSTEITLPSVSEGKLPQIVRDQYGEVMALQAKFKEAKALLQNSVDAFQAACPHGNEVKVMHYEYAAARDKTLKHFICQDCGRIRLPRRGLRTDVCKLCDGDMEYKGRCCDEDHTMIYECVACGYTEEAT